MKNKKSLLTLDDLIFEHRNKAYGAYALRKNYGNRLGKAFLITVLPILLFFLSSFWILEKENKEEPVKKYKDHKLIEWPELAEPPIILEQKELMQPKPIQKEILAQVEIPEFVEPIDDAIEILEADIPTDEEIEISVIGHEKLEGKEAVGSFVKTYEVEQEGTIELDIVIEEPKEEDAFMRSEVMPEFNGGIKKMYKWLNRNLRYPSLASRNGVEGKVFIAFIVEKDGSISEVRILKGIGFGCDLEAERVVQKMPKWKAGKQNGKTVRVRYTLPLHFKMTY